ncbi:MAG: FecR domain-containing protein [Nevskia sp.]|nr:FecR domain-containing protein [Nevskia sp.]
MASRAYAMGGAARSGSVRRWAVPATLAAGLAVALLGYRLAPSINTSPAEVVYATAAGEHRDLTLQDGSVVHLDVASNIKVRMGVSQRQISLLAGRALFEVAHDAIRPFTVSSGGERVTAIGTRFQVEREDQFVVVTLTDGSVSVAPEAADAASQQEILQVGDQLKIKLADGTWIKRTVDPQVATSWSHGRLIFRATPLAEALEEVNRYASKKVRLGDATLGELPVSGSFIAGDSGLVVSAFAAVLPVRAVDAGQEIVLFRRDEDNATQG